MRDPATQADGALYVGHVMHRRLRPRVHRLRYRLFSLLLDLDRLDETAARLRLFSRGGFNLFAFHDRDYGEGGDEPLRAQVERHLARAGLTPDGGAIRLLTMPRVLGFAFNPLSVYFCHDRAGGLRAILYEVNNTFGQRHSYLLPVANGGAGMVRQSCAKDFHVSPFLPMALDYGFRVVPPGQDLAIAITVADEAGPLLFAVHRAGRRALSDGALLRAFVTHPLLPLKVVGGILWEAAKLWAKRVAVHRLPAAPPHSVSLPASSPLSPSPLLQGEQPCI